MFKADAPEDLIAKIVEMADAARKGGFLALEEMEIPNPFMQKGIDLWWTAMMRMWCVPPCKRYCLDR